MPTEGDEGEPYGVVMSATPIAIDIGPFHVVLPEGTRSDDAARLLYMVMRALERGETDLTHVLIVIQELPNE